MYKNEEKNIRNVIENTLPYTEIYFLVDTGTTDKTNEIINDLEKKNSDTKFIKTEIPFIDYVKTREKTLDFVKNSKLVKRSKDKFLLTMDCDETLVNMNQNKFELPNGSAIINTKIREDGGSIYDRVRFISMDLIDKFHYKGCNVHEYLSYEEPDKSFLDNSVSYNVFRASNSFI